MRKLSYALLAGLSVPAILSGASFTDTMEELEVQNPDFFLYTGLEDDFATAGNFLTEAYMAYLSTGATIPPVPVNFGQLFERLGLNNLTSLAAVSEAREAGGFRNQVRYSFSSPPKGLFILGGDVNRPFTVQDDAPADADLIAEFRFNGLALYQMLQNIIVDIMGPMGQGIIDAQMSERIGGTGPTFADLFNQLSTQAHLVVRAPTGAETPILPAVPFLNGMLVLRIDNIADLFNAYAPLFAEKGIRPIGTEESPAWQWSLPTPGVPVSLFMQTIEETNDLLVTLNTDSSEWYLKGKRKSIAGSPEFIDTVSGLPLSGLSFWYSTERMSEAQLESLHEQLSAPENLTPVIEVVKSFLSRYRGPQAGVSRLEENAYRVVSYQPVSYKTNMALAATVLPLGFLSASAMAGEAADAMEEEAPLPGEPVDEEEPSPAN